MDELLKPLSSQWQLAFLALCLVMGALIWRGHRQITRLGLTAEKMTDQLRLLAHTIEAIEGRTTNTEHTLVANLSEYRMSVGNTSSYRQYLQKLGVAPASDIEPLLEAVPDGALAVGQDGRIVYVNRVLFDLTGLQAGETLAQMVDLCDLRTLDGSPLTPDQSPDVRVLNGEEIHEVLIRMRPQGVYQDLILMVNGSPVRDIFGRVVAAVMVARATSEEMALAIEVRRMAEREQDAITSSTSQSER